MSSSPAPNPGEYWKAPASASQGEPEVSVIFTAVGAALSNWEHVEASFATMFGTLLEGARFAAERVFGTMVSNSNKRTALSAASSVVFVYRHVSEADTETWKLLLRHYDEASIRRTEIAHGVVTGVSTDKPHGLFLMPPTYNTKKVTLPWIAAQKEGIDVFGHQYRYTSEDIYHFHSRFGDLVNWTLGFHSEYIQKYCKTPLPKTP